MTTPDDRTPYTPGPQPSPYAFGQPIPGMPTLPQPAPAPKKSRLWLVFAAVAGIIIVITATVAITLGAQRGTTPAADRPQTAWDKEQAAATTTPDPTPVVVDNTPGVSDMRLTLKTTSKQCFGSAGCNLTVKVNLGYGGPTLSTDDTWQITYEINGVTDGPVIGSFELTGDEYDVNEEILETKNSKSKVSVKVTSVEKVGL